MPAAAAESKSIAVQPVGRLVSVKCPTRMPGTSVSDPAGAVWAADVPHGASAPAPTVHPNSRRVHPLNSSEYGLRVTGGSLHRWRTRSSGLSRPAQAGSEDPALLIHMRSGATAEASSH